MIRSININIIIRGGINQVPQCVRNADLKRVKIACQHLQFCHTKSDSTCLLDILLL